MLSNRADGMLICLKPWSKHRSEPAEAPSSGKVVREGLHRIHDGRVQLTLAGMSGHCRPSLAQAGMGHYNRGVMFPGERAQGGKEWIGLRRPASG